MYPALQACRRRSQIVIELLTALSRIRAGLHRVTEGCLQRYELPDEAERPWSPSWLPHGCSNGPEDQARAVRVLSIGVCPFFQRKPTFGPRSNPMSGPVTLPSDRVTGAANACTGVHNNRTRGFFMG